MLSYKVATGDLDAPPIDCWESSRAIYTPPRVLSMLKEEPVNLKRIGAYFGKELSIMQDTGSLKQPVLVNIDVHVICSPI